jgi:LacI family transcriptional regulator
MTVSRVINGKKNVKASTRARVEAAIHDLNYSPNPAATSLARDDLIRIGLLYGNPSAAYLSEFLVGGLEECSRWNVQLVVEQCEPGNENAVAEHLIESGIDGIILPPPLCDASSVIKVLAAARTPAVAVATGSPADSVSAVSIDDYRAAAAMTRHLINLGHQRIGFIIGHPNQTASGRRLGGYRAALADARIPEASELITQGFFTYRSGLDAAETLLPAGGDLAGACVEAGARFQSSDQLAAIDGRRVRQRAVARPRQSHGDWLSKNDRRRGEKEAGRLVGSEAIGRADRSLNRVQGSDARQRARFPQADCRENLGGKGRS